METRTIRVTGTVFDLETFDEVSVGKETTFLPPDSMEQALQQLGNDESALLQIVIDGLEEKAKRDLRNDNSVSWRTFKLDDEGEETEELNGEFSGKTIPVEKMKEANGLILNLAKTAFGFGKGMSREAKRDAKEKAKAMVKAMPAVLEGLRASVAGK